MENIYVKVKWSFESQVKKSREIKSRQKYKMSSSMPQQKSFSVDELNQLHLSRGLIRDCNSLCRVLNRQDLQNLFKKIDAESIA